MIFLLEYILKFYYFHQAFLHSKNHDLYISFHDFQVYFFLCKDESNLNNENLHRDLMLFSLIIQIYFLQQDNAIFYYLQSLVKLLVYYACYYILIRLQLLFV